MTFSYDSENVIDNERRKFQPDTAGDVAVNVISKDIVDAISGTTNTTPSIFNVNCVTAGVEYSQALPANTKGFILQARGQSRIDFAYSTGAADTLTLFPGVTFHDSNFYSSRTIYFKCSKNNEVVEIVAYT